MILLSYLLLSPPFSLLSCFPVVSSSPSPHTTAAHSAHQLHYMLHDAVLKTGTVNRFCSSPKTSRPALRPPTFLLNRFQGSFLRLNGQDTKLTAHLYLILRLRMSGAVPLLPLFTFMLWMVIPFNSRFLLFSIHPTISIPDICPTNRPAQLPFCSLLH